MLKNHILSLPKSIWLLCTRHEGAKTRTDTSPSSYLCPFPVVFFVSFVSSPCLPFSQWFVFSSPSLSFPSISFCPLLPLSGLYYRHLSADSDVFTPPFLCKVLSPPPFNSQTGFFCCVCRDRLALNQPFPLTQCQPHAAFSTSGSCKSIKKSGWKR